MWDIDFNRLRDVFVYDPQAPMIFSSGIFLWLFAAFILVYLLLQHRLTARLLFVTAFSYYFYYKRYDEKPIFEIVRRLSDCIMGCLIIIPEKYANELWELNRNAMLTLNDVGLIDDDQLIHLMSYRKKPDIFNLIESDWFLPLKTYGGDNLITLREGTNDRVKNVARSMKHYVKKQKLSFRNAYILYKSLMEK